MAMVELEVDRVLQLILPRIKSHISAPPSIFEKGSYQRPFKLAVTGLQGSGKSTWSAGIVDAINKTGLKAKTLSLDDLYLPHEGLVAVCESNPGNRLVRTRGQPGTHDLELAKWFFEQFDQPTTGEKLFPIFDKSKFGGEGDRLPKSEWHRSEPREVVDVLVFEGWCMGFQAVSEIALRTAWEEARAVVAASTDDADIKLPIKTIANHELEHLNFINQRLGEYNDMFMGPQHWDYLVHLDTDDLRNVYAWRLEQEAWLWKLKGTGMSDEAVIEFIKGYMPAYELYLGHLRRGFFQALGERKANCQLSMKLDSARRIVEIREL
ncbi:hypothetical protein TWF102_000530 [Orbilia oligospora]|uniref:P-loop containing nucleoside triphosphate hydrolase protein n=1 Tax=Orbilia oligospora TaxID=2813651 RepID=A0A7C8N231_ORBOL|nr:hypothetical protein TWF102_000530 [Orbilia oligospora]KAF3104343.1 hypothetical protein TWF103_006999 [Orbilia oligospora]KAF3104344.1 hypothetical protein TWF103_006999 [Orbilia oligospora]